MCKIKEVRPRLNSANPMNQLVCGPRFLLATIFLLCLPVLILAQGTSNQAPGGSRPATPTNQQPVPTQQPAQSGGSSSGQLTAGAPVDSANYKVGPSDVLDVRVWREPEFSGAVTVHEDGQITLPLVGDLKAGGMTPIQIQKEVTEALAKYVVKPLVTVTVQQVLSKRYYMDGEVARRGEYPLVTPTTVFEAISRAGGLAEFANSKKIYILRGEKKIPFNYKDVSHGKHMEENVLLEPGDHIVVP